MRRTIIGLAVVGLTVAAGVPTAQSAPRAVVTQIDAKFGPLYDNIYSADGLTETKIVHVRAGHTVKVPFQVQNDAAVADLSPHVHGDGNAAPFTVVYKNGSGNITTDVESGAYVTGTLFTTLQQDLFLYVTARPSASRGENEIFTISALSSIGKGITDVIRVKARVR